MNSSVQHCQLHVDPILTPFFVCAIIVITTRSFKTFTKLFSATIYFRIVLSSSNFLRQIFNLMNNNASRIVNWEEFVERECPEVLGLWGWIPWSAYARGIIWWESVVNYKMPIFNYSCHCGKDMEGLIILNWSHPEIKQSESATVFQTSL